MEIVDFLDIGDKKLIVIVIIILVSALIFEKQRNIILGAGLYRIINWILDNPVWIAVQLIWGARGVLVMVIGAVLYNTILFIYFRNKEANFTLWNSIRGFSEKELEYKNKFKEWKENRTPWKFVLVIGSYVPMKMFFFLLKIVKVPFWGNSFALLTLSIFEDPFVATTYIRSGNKERFDFKIIGVFLLSISISLGYWSIRNGLITEFIIRPAMF